MVIRAGNLSSLLQRAHAATKVVTQAAAKAATPATKAATEAAAQMTARGPGGGPMEALRNGAKDFAQAGVENKLESDTGISARTSPSAGGAAYSAVKAAVQAPDLQRRMSTALDSLERKLTPHPRSDPGL
jgi:hypothetical protein